MSWLAAWGIPCCRINSDEFETRSAPALRVVNGRTVFSVQRGGRPISSEEIDVVWFRRWGSSAMPASHICDPIGDEDHREFNVVAASQHLVRERRAIAQAFFGALGHAEWLNHPKYCNLNKIEVLAIAQRCGLTVPDTLVTADLREAQEFAAAHINGVITKCAADVSVFKVHASLVSPVTRSPESDDLRDPRWEGFPSLLQERIPRQYELRVFYIDGVCVSVAKLYSRANAHAVDGRMVDTMRSVPFILPGHVEEALRTLMAALSLDLGCIDIVRASDGRWVFLEVNPNGQFWADDLTCNSQLHRRVAESLTRRLHERSARQ